MYDIKPRNSIWLLLHHSNVRITPNQVLILLSPLIFWLLITTKLVHCDQVKACHHHHFHHYCTIIRLFSGDLLFLTVSIQEPDGWIT